MPDFAALFDEDIDGTAIAHIGRGLFEAHARDEAGFEDEAGHNQMWFAARDIAFENPVTEDETQLMLPRMGINVGPGADSPPRARRRRVLPDDVDFTLEMLVGRMIGLLLIEISAFHRLRVGRGRAREHRPRRRRRRGRAARLATSAPTRRPHVA